MSSINEDISNLFQEIEINKDKKPTNLKEDRGQERQEIQSINEVLTNLFDIKPEEVEEKLSIAEKLKLERKITTDDKEEGLSKEEVITNLFAYNDKEVVKLIEDKKEVEHKENEKDITSNDKEDKFINKEDIKEIEEETTKEVIKEVKEEKKEKPKEIKEVSKVKKRRKLPLIRDKEKEIEESKVKNSEIEKEDFKVMEEELKKPNIDTNILSEDTSKEISEDLGKELTVEEPISANLEEDLENKVKEEEVEIEPETPKEDLDIETTISKEEIKDISKKFEKETVEDIEKIVEERMTDIGKKTTGVKEDLKNTEEVNYDTTTQEGLANTIIRQVNNVKTLEEIGEIKIPTRRLTADLTNKIISAMTEKTLEFERLEEEERQRKVAAELEKIRMEEERKRKEIEELSRQEELEKPIVDKIVKDIKLLTTMEELKAFDYEEEIKLDHNINKIQLAMTERVDALKKEEVEKLEHYQRQKKRLEEEERLLEEQLELLSKKNQDKEDKEVIEEKKDLNLEDTDPILVNEELIKSKVNKNLEEQKELYKLKKELKNTPIKSSNSLLGGIGYRKRKEALEDIKTINSELGTGVDTSTNSDYVLWVKEMHTLEGQKNVIPEYEYNKKKKDLMAKLSKINSPIPKSMDIEEKIEVSEEVEKINDIKAPLFVRDNKVKEKKDVTKVSNTEDHKIDLEKPKQMTYKEESLIEKEIRILKEQERRNKEKLEELKRLKELASKEEKVEEVTEQVVKEEITEEKIDTEVDNNKNKDIEKETIVDTEEDDIIIEDKNTESEEVENLSLEEEIKKREELLRQILGEDI